jgi:A/G-specific adenine glycosylase
MQRGKTFCLDRHKKLYFRKKVLQWFGRNRRMFPWRERIDPFHILIAEMLLQQTDAAKVAAMYDQFIEAFRTPAFLACATKLQVAKFISKIGLNYRVPRLINAAVCIQSRFGGTVPNDLNSLLSIPGVGPYVANAVLVVAFRQKNAVLDTNVIRVLERFFGLRSRRTRPRTDPQLWLAARELLPKDRRLARTWNWALLDFGATVCRHRSQLCGNCPCRRLCYAKSTRELGLESPRRMPRE